LNTATNSPKKTQEFEPDVSEPYDWGRLKGWLTNHIQASEELNIPVKFSEKVFKGNFHLPTGKGLLMLEM